MGREAELNKAKREMRETEMNEWFRKERSLVVFKPQGTEDTFSPAEIGHGVKADIEGESLVVSAIVDFGPGKNGPVPIRYYGKGEWARVEFDVPPRTVVSKLVIPEGVAK